MRPNEKVHPALFVICKRIIFASKLNLSDERKLYHYRQRNRQGVLDFTCPCRSRRHHVEAFQERSMALPA